MKRSVHQQVVPLSDGLSAYVTVTRVGQQELTEGDAVVVSGQIALPIDPVSKYKSLHRSLQFGDRVTLGGGVLSFCWGDYGPATQMRYKLRHFVAATWREGIDQAKAWATTEVDKLVKALAQRRAVLEAAGGAVREVKRIRYIALTEALVAVLTVEWLGQQPAREGDDLIVLATIGLPCDPEKRDRLHQELEFGFRAKVAGLALTHGWGILDSSTGQRICSRRFVVSNLEEGFAQADEWTTTEISRLTKALQQRRAALEAASEGRETLWKN